MLCEPGRHGDDTLRFDMWMILFGVYDFFNSETSENLDVEAAQMSFLRV